MPAETTNMETTAIDSTDVERHRRRLFGIAYRMLGDVQDAEDVVQDAFVRWHQADRAAVRAPEAWLVTAVNRLAIDRLRRAATERATYVGPWLPEPLATSAADERAAPPDRAAELASDLSMAFLVLLERLAPEERAAFLMREVFDTDYAEIARTLGRSEAAVRQMVHRAGVRVRGDRKRFAAPPDARERLLHRFLAALEAGDQAGLLAVFADDATFVSDGGGKVSSVRNVIVGPARIARLFLGLERKYGYVVRHRLTRLNGGPALLGVAGDRIISATVFESDGERITAVYRVLNPDKLRKLGRTR